MICKPSSQQRSVPAPSLAGATATRQGGGKGAALGTASQSNPHAPEGRSLSFFLSDGKGEWLMGALQAAQRSRQHKPAHLRQHLEAPASS